MSTQSRRKMPISYPDEPAGTLMMLRDQDRWGMWPYLPLKRPGIGMPECVLVWAYTTDPEEKHPIPIYKAYLYQLPKTKEEFLATKLKEYASFEALVADGWVVD